MHPARIKITTSPGVAVTLVTVAYAIAATPFLLGRADSWDMVGHTFHAWMQREMLPQLAFWNPYFFSGYEQFTAYPPMVSVLVSLLSLAIGLTAAFKSVVVVSWLALPAAVYFLNRGLVGPRLAAVGCAVTSLLLVAAQQQIGGTFFSTFVVGNVANGLGLLFVVLCLGYLARENFRAAIPLLALVLVTHMVASVAMSIFVVSKLVLDRRAAQLSLSYGLAAWWLLPALLDSFRNIRPHDDYPLGLLEYLAYGVVFAAFVAYRASRSDRRPDFLVLGSLVVFLLTGLLPHLSRDLWLAVPMHYHRLKIYPLVALLPVALLMIREAALAMHRDSHRRRVMAGWRTGAVAPAAAILIVASAWSKPLLRPAPFRPPAIEVVGTRVMTVEALPRAPYWHNLRHALARQGHLVAKGLFIEATPDGPFLLDLEQILHARHEPPMGWGISWDLAAVRDERFVAHLPALLDFFGIQAIVADQPLSIAAPRDSLASDSGYTVVERPGQELVDTPPHPIAFTGRPLGDREWRRHTRSWFLGRSKELVVDSEAREYSAQGSARLVDHNRHFNWMKITVTAAGPTPVYIRMGYSSKWRAWAEDRELPVYRATPNNMMVFADRDFELRFEPRNRYNVVGLLLSALSLVAYGLLLRRPAMPPARGRSSALSHPNPSLEGKVRAQPRGFRDSSDQGKIPRSS